MSAEYLLETAVAFADVDRDRLLLLPRLFKLLQEAAIRHADGFGAGTKAISERGMSWVLNRLAITIERYPRYEEAVRIVTWSTGVRGFKGFREFRVFGGDEPLAAASSLWLWVDLKTKTLARVPADLAAGFPVGDAGPLFRADLETLRPAAPATTAATVEVSLRHSDLDANGHLNHTAYFDCLQTALVGRGQSPRPRELAIQFLKEIPAGAERVAVRLEPRAPGNAFAVGCGGADCALGFVA